MDVHVILILSKCPLSLTERNNKRKL